MIDQPKIVEWPGKRGLLITGKLLENTKCELYLIIILLGGCKDCS